MFTDYKKENTNVRNHKAFTLVEMLLALGIIGFVTVLSLGLAKTIPAFRIDSYTRKYCELLDGAVTSAVGANRLDNAASATLAQIHPYLKGDLTENDTKIVMNDGSVITGGGASYTVTFPFNNESHIYTISHTNGLDCAIGDVVEIPPENDEEDGGGDDDGGNGNGGGGEDPYHPIPGGGGLPEDVVVGDGSGGDDK